MKYNQRTEERKVALAVRPHPTIELVEDRLYVLTCGRAGFQNSKNEVSVVQLKVALPSDPIRKIDTVLEGKRYKLRAEVLDHDRKCYVLLNQVSKLKITLKPLLKFQSFSFTLYRIRGTTRHLLINQ